MHPTADLVNQSSDFGGQIDSKEVRSLLCEDFGVIAPLDGVLSAAQYLNPLLLVTSCGQKAGRDAEPSAYAIPTSRPTFCVIRSLARGVRTPAE